MRLHMGVFRANLQLMQTEITQEKGDMTVYEVSYLLLPSLAVEQVPANAVALEKVLTSAGGVVLSGEEPVLIDLAYPMTKVVQTVRHKATKGYFGWIKFEAAPEAIEVVKKALDGNEHVLRYLIIKTVRENTLLNGKMKFQKEEKVGREEDGEETPEAVKESVSEDVDKGIEELVA
jgi:ribosomal protein S6